MSRQSHWQEVYAHQEGDRFSWFQPFLCRSDLWHDRALFHFCRFQRQ
ncbi:MAG: hypothetical protein HQL72_09595 [Magnetococcales bacterium]|nr:hypothetical protein [Magnetococcales bacterium]